jgi:hypothetical protein
MPTMLNRISIVTPVLNDWESLGMLVRSIADLYAGSGLTFRVLAVDDGSAAPFDPASLVLPADSCVAEIVVVPLAVNIGHQRAIAVGLSRVSGWDDTDAVIVIDSDGEDRPEDIAALHAAALANPGMAVLARRARRSETRVFKTGYVTYKFLFRTLTGRTIDFGNFSFLPIGVVRRLVHMPELWNNLAAALMRSRLPCTTIAVNRGSRYAGSSKMNLPSLIVHGLSAMSVWTDVIFVRVLMAASGVAVLTVLGMLAVVTIRVFTDVAIPGWATTMFGDLLIILMQTLVLMVATSLMVLAGRSQRPIVPIIDAEAFLMRGGIGESPYPADTARALRSQQDCPELSS